MARRAATNEARQWQRRQRGNEPVVGPALDVLKSSTGPGDLLVNIVVMLLLLAVIIAPLVLIVGLFAWLT